MADAEHPEQEIASSATALKQSAAEQVDSADRRTRLAADRTVLAAERTYAAWVHTGLAAFVPALPPARWSSRWCPTGSRQPPA